MRTAPESRGGHPEDKYHQTMTRIVMLRRRTV